MAEPTPEARTLVRRLLDPAAAWSGADDRWLRELCRDDPAAAALYNRTMVRHRVLAGGDPHTPTGFELARRAAASVDLALGAAPAAGPIAHVARPVRRWLAWLAPALAAAVAALVLVPALTARGPDPDAYVGARGIPASGLPERRAGLGLGGVTAEGDEYEAVFAPAHLEDWLRLSYTNERPDLGWLFVFAVQPERPAGEQLVWIAPTPEEARSAPIAAARLRQLPFEVRLGARHVAGPVRFVALFTARPLTTDAIVAAWTSLASSARDALPSDLEARLRTLLQLSPGDVVQVLATRIVPGSAADPPAAPGKEATPR